jgi:hypothetical protein
MKTYFDLIHVPSEFLSLAGTLDPAARIYRAKGDHDQLHLWLDGLFKHVGPCVPLGVTACYTGVTRPGVYRRLKAGRLTAFSFALVGETKTLLGGQKKLKEGPLVYIPFSECQAWWRELNGRIKRLERMKEVQAQFTAESRASAASQNSGAGRQDDAFLWNTQSGK